MFMHLRASKNTWKKSDQTEISNRQTIIAGYFNTPFSVVNFLKVVIKSIEYGRLVKHNH